MNHITECTSHLLKAIYVCRLVTDGFWMHLNEEKEATHTTNSSVNSRWEDGRNHLTNTTRFIEIKDDIPTGDEHSFISTSREERFWLRHNIFITIILSHLPLLFQLSLLASQTNLNRDMTSSSEKWNHRKRKEKKRKTMKEDKNEDDGSGKHDQQQKDWPLAENSRIVFWCTISLIFFDSFSFSSKYFFFTWTAFSLIAVLVLCSLPGRSSCSLWSPTIKTSSNLSHHHESRERKWEKMRTIPSLFLLMPPSTLWAWLRPSTQGTSNIKYERKVVITSDTRR